MRLKMSDKEGLYQEWKEHGFTKKFFRQLDEMIKESLFELRNVDKITRLHRLQSRIETLEIVKSLVEYMRDD